MYFTQRQQTNIPICHIKFFQIENEIKQSMSFLCASTGGPHMGYGQGQMGRMQQPMQYPPQAAGHEVMYNSFQLYQLLVSQICCIISKLVN